MGILDRLNKSRREPSTFHVTPRTTFNVTETKAARNFSYFTEFTFRKGVFYAIVLIYVSSVSIIICVETLMSDHLICDKSRITEEHLAATQLEYHNPSYIFHPCDHIRLPALLWMTRYECNFGRRLLAAVLLGGIVGWERRQADRPAGIRTMSLVSLGACLFSINSAYAFLDGPMSWDSSRISAAIPSGVGFLGAGLIFKEAEKDKETGDTTHVVHGLTTAASLWISAAVGTACAGQLYFSATFAIALILTLLRFGPRQQSQDDDEGDDEDDDYLKEFDMQQHSQRPTTSYQSASVRIDATHPDNLSNEHMDPEAQPLNSDAKRTDAPTTAASITSRGAARKRRPNAASLGGIL